MTYAYIHDVPIGAELHEAIIAKLGPRPLDGLLLHLVLRQPGGTLRYIDVWSSREQCDRAFEERIHPAVGTILREHGVGHPDEPRRTEVDVVALTLGPTGVV